MIVLMNANDVTETLMCTLLMQNIDFLSTFQLSGIQIRSCTAFIIKQKKQFEADNAADDLCAVKCEDYLLCVVCGAGLWPGVLSAVVVVCPPSH